MNWHLALAWILRQRTLFYKLSFSTFREKLDIKKPRNPFLGSSNSECLDFLQCVSKHVYNQKAGKCIPQISITSAFSLNPGGSSEAFYLASWHGAPSPFPFCLSFQTGSCYVAQVDLKLLDSSHLLSQSPQLLRLQVSATKTGLKRDFLDAWGGWSGSLTVYIWHNTGVTV